MHERERVKIYEWSSSWLIRNVQREIIAPFSSFTSEARGGNTPQRPLFARFFFLRTLVTGSGRHVTITSVINAGFYVQVFASFFFHGESMKKGLGTLGNAWVSREIFKSLHWSRSSRRFVWYLMREDLLFLRFVKCKGRISRGMKFSLNDFWNWNSKIKDGSLTNRNWEKPR